MRKLLNLIIPFTLIAVAGCGGGKKETKAAGEGSLTIMCGAGIRAAMEPVCKAFEDETGSSVRVIYAGSGTLLGQLSTGTEADLFLPGDVQWVNTAREKELVGEQVVVAWFVPVIAVPKDNPANIETLKDLARDDVKVGLGKPDACAIGGVSRDVLAAAGLKGKVTPEFEALTVNQLADQVKLDALDAAIIWDATAVQYTDAIKSIQLEDPLFHAVPLALALVKDSKKHDLARSFMAFAAGETGAELFRKHNYRVPGNQLRIGCGGSMRPPVDELAKMFEEQTGCKTLRNYGGSGTVLLQIQESGDGDVYICHDPFAYTCEDKGLSANWYTMAVIEPTLAVQKGNPKNVQGLKDLLRKDVKVGLSHREYSMRGKIIWAIMEEHGMADAMRKRAIFEERTHTLVNQLKLGAVDVATLWDAPAKAMEEIEAIPIEKKYRIDAVTSATSNKTYDPQRVKVTVVRLTLADEPLLAAQFAKFCLSDTARHILKKHRFALPDEE
ncbi:MAG: molybdate ABC transporter substrate-binding protein [Chitinivibrionales bacterium]|nr:molybdate ABC transporter substrate-binding protein [Chitinivibrionales bacterium]MBD3356393.1 molybdate ABC transporter substrate-binding protein [Chitinivibrionales bacterium]